MAELTSPRLRHHVYPDHLYGRTPQLAMPGGNLAASNLARLMVKLGVDGRGPQNATASARERIAKLPRLATVRRAAGFLVNVRLNKSDGTGAVRAQYMYKRDLVGLLVADRPPGSSGRIFDQRWVLEDGIYRPLSPLPDPDLKNCAAEYAGLWSRVMHTEVDSILGVVYAKLNVYRPLPPSVIGIAGTTAPQGQLEN